MRWAELLEKFRATQERARRAPRGSSGAGALDGAGPGPAAERESPPPRQRAVPDKDRRGERAFDDPRGSPSKLNGAGGAALLGGSGRGALALPQVEKQKGKGGLGGIGRFGVGGRKTKR